MWHFVYKWKGIHTLCTFGRIETQLAPSGKLLHNLDHLLNLDFIILPIIFWISDFLEAFLEAMMQWLSAYIRYMLNFPSVRQCTTDIQGRNIPSMVLGKCVGWVWASEISVAILYLHLMRRYVVNRGGDHHWHSVPTWPVCVFFVHFIERYVAWVTYSNECHTVKKLILKVQLNSRIMWWMSIVEWCGECLESFKQLIAKEWQT